MEHKDTRIEMAELVQYYGTGRRKSSVARVFLRPGSGDITVNGMITMVNIAMSGDDLATCPAADANNDGHVTIDEIVGAVHEALSRMNMC